VAGREGRARRLLAVAGCSAAAAPRTRSGIQGERRERLVKGEGHCTSSILAVSCCLFSAFILLEGCICKLLTRSIVTFVIAPPCVSPEACN
jgi:hypothetical protein